MPTLDQLEDIWDANQEIFGDNPLNDGYPQRNDTGPFTGKTIGKVIYNVESGEQRIVIAMNDDTVDVEIQKK